MINLVGGSDRLVVLDVLSACVVAVAPPKVTA
jgi:hypothetical protein